MLVCSPFHKTSPVFEENHLSLKSDDELVKASDQAIGVRLGRTKLSNWNFEIVPVFFYKWKILSFLFMACFFFFFHFKTLLPEYQNNTCLFVCIVISSPSPPFSYPFVFFQNNAFKKIWDSASCSYSLLLSHLSLQ